MTKRVKTMRESSYPPRSGFYPAPIPAADGSKPRAPAGSAADGARRRAHRWAKARGLAFAVGLLCLGCPGEEEEEEEKRVDQEQAARARVAREYCASQSSCDPATFSSEFSSVAECEQVVEATLTQVVDIYGQICADAYLAYYDCVGDDVCASEHCSNLAEQLIADCPAG